MTRYIFEVTSGVQFSSVCLTALLPDIEENKSLSDDCVLACAESYKCLEPRLQTEREQHKHKQRRFRIDLYQMMVLNEEYTHDLLDIKKSRLKVVAPLYDSGNGKTVILFVSLITGTSPKVQLADIHLHTTTVDGYIFEVPTSQVFEMRRQSSNKHIKLMCLFTGEELHWKEEYMPKTMASDFAQSMSLFGDTQIGTLLPIIDGYNNLIGLDKSLAGHTNHSFERICVDGIMSSGLSSLGKYMEFVDFLYVTGDIKVRVSELARIKRKLVLTLDLLDYQRSSDICNEIIGMLGDFYDYLAEDIAVLVSIKQLRNSKCLDTIVKYAKNAGDSGVSIIIANKPYSELGTLEEKDEVCLIRTNYNNGGADIWDEEKINSLYLEDLGGCMHSAVMIPFGQWQFADKNTEEIVQEPAPTGVIEFIGTVIDILSKNTEGHNKK